jgi:hypothetical protein
MTMARKKVSTLPEDDEGKNVINHRGRGREFTIIANAIFEDDRLSAEAKLVLCWMLSKPEDWVFVPAVAAKKLKIGRDKLYRILNQLIAVGYVIRDIERDKSCRIVRVRYITTDEPIAKTSGGEVLATEGVEPLPGNQEEAFCATSRISRYGDPGQLLSTESNQDLPPYPPRGEGGSSEDLASEEGLPSSDALAEPVAPLAAISSKPEVVERGAAPRAAEPAAPRDMGAGGPSFDAMAKAYPGPMLSRPETERAWRSLSPSERQAAIDGVAWYVRDSAAQKPFPRKLRDLKRYLRGKIWEGAKASAAATAIPIRGGTLQAAAWLEHERSAGHPTSYIEDCWRQGKPWYARSEWPPSTGRAA